MTNPVPRRPNKRLGQHFLTDAAVLERIAAALRLAPEDHVVEIGPGTGVLTARLLDEGARVVAVEVDASLAAQLRRRLPAAEIIAADALRVCWEDVLGAPGAARWRVVGNLPYNIATPLLGQWFALAGQVFDMHFMVQAEVAARLAAQPRTKAYGRLSVLAQLHCRIERLFDVPPSSFTPPPKVESSFVRLVAAPPVACDLSALSEVLRVCFSMRRKTLAHAVRSLDRDMDLGFLNGTGLMGDLAAESKSPSARQGARLAAKHARAEELTVSGFVALANRYAEARRSRQAGPCRR